MLPLALLSQGREGGNRVSREQGFKEQTGNAAPRGGSVKGPGKGALLRRPVPQAQVLKHRDVTGACAGLASPTRAQHTNRLQHDNGQS